MAKTILSVLVLLVLIIGGGYFYGQAHHTTAVNDSSSVSFVVSQFGAQMQKVSLMASGTPSELAQYYAPYVAADLIAQWQANPVAAPGREVSSPWPDHIQVDSATLERDGSYTVRGSVIELTSQEVTHGGMAGQYPVTLTLKKTGDQWLITGYERGAEATTTSSQ